MYNVASGRALAMGELVQTFIARAARDVRVVQNPARFRPNDQPLLVGDRSRLTGDTGWQPEIPLETDRRRHPRVLARRGGYGVAPGASAAPERPWPCLTGLRS